MDIDNDKEKKRRIEDGSERKTRPSSTVVYESSLSLSLSILCTLFKTLGTKLVTELNV